MFRLRWNLLAFVSCVGLLGMLGNACTPTPATEPSLEQRNEPSRPPEPRQEPKKEPVVENKADASELVGEPDLAEPAIPEDKEPEPQQEPQKELISDDSDGSSGESIPEPTKETTPDNPPKVCGTTHTFSFGQEVVTVRCQELGTQVQGVSLRSYTMTTTHSLRDNLPAGKQETFQEDPAYPFVRTSSILLDALFAMAVHETRLNSVTQVKEFAFQKGKPVRCQCFQTGEKWTWAWTRDTAYAIDLSLAWLDPQRSMETLLFKISARKSGGSPQLVQDTGSGGSWPVSSDRVTWAIAAGRLLPLLTSTQKKTFLQKGWPALKNTLEHDRQWIFDASDGLYRGEQSFLDWREQSYPSWIPNDLAVMTASKALSTNVNHLAALDTAVLMARELGLLKDEQRYQGWADALRKAIVQQLLSSQNKWFNTLKLELAGGIVTERSDLLGNSLAVLWRVGTDKQRADAVDAYPHSTMGTAVLWPQQPLTRIYHNRAIWPFVSAYSALAAQQTNNSKVVAHTLFSLVRAGALNLSHMENLEWLTGNNFVQDGAFSGPVVNSRRQLWSVAGFLGMFLRGVFGVQTTYQGTRFAPMLPLASVQRWLKGTKMSLYNLSIHGKKLQLHLRWPRSTRKDGALALKRLFVNQHSFSQTKYWKPALLKADNVVEMSLGWEKTREVLKLAPNPGNYRNVYSPKEPEITRITKTGTGVELTFSARGETGVRFLVYRGGTKVATVSGGSWVDKGLTALDSQTPCYNLIAQFTDTGHMSHPSTTRCYTPVGDGREQWLEAWQFRSEAGKWKWQGNTLWLEDWGEVGKPLTIGPFRPHRSGKVRLSIRFQNPNGPVNTGITCATKQVEVWEVGGTAPVATGRWSMPHTAKGKASMSTSFVATLDAGKRYQLLVKEPKTPPNMSYFSHFTTYTAGAGGGASTFNRASVQAVRLLYLTGSDARPATGKLVQFDGNNDLNKLKSTQIVKPGIPLETWARFGMTWDKDWLYIAIVSKGFEKPLKAFLLYLETTKGSFSAARSSRGMTYLKQQSHLPFTPDYVLGVREQTDINDGFGPWNGLWKKTSGGWSLQRRFKPGRDTFVASDKHTISIRISRSLLGAPTKLRLSGHLIHAVSGHEWKVVLPSNHTPWKQKSSGFYEVDLSQTSSTNQWKTR